MGEAKQITVKPIAAADAQRIVRALHYSHSVVKNSQLHFGVFIGERCGGAMQFGPSMDKRKILPLVRGTLWNESIELNRMAFADWLPRNSESRAIAYALRFIRKHYPWIKWVVTFADATQCGCGTIYRASGFVLTGLRENKTILRLPDGTITTDITLNTHSVKTGQTSGWWKRRGALALKGAQMRYIYFLDPSARARLTVPVLPFSEIARRGYGMYRGKLISRAGSSAVAVPEDHSGEGGSIPTPALQFIAAHG